MSSGRTPQPGHMGSDTDDPGPVGEASWRRRTGKTSFRAPGTSAVRIVSRQIANGRVSLSLSLSRSLKISFPAQSFVSRLRYRFAPVLHIWIPPFLYFCFVLSGRRRGYGEQHTLIWHEGGIFRPKMKKN